MTGIPLGQHETNNLEFKQKDSLSQPESIGREIVGMLNSAGGEIWIGIKEQDGTAASLDPINDPESARKSLRDYLADVLEPAPQGDEVKIDVERDPDGRHVLRISALPSEDRKPYALLKKSGRHFFIRSDDRLRPMSREEIAKQFQSRNPAQNAPDSAVPALRKERDALQKSEGIYWIGLQPQPPEALNIQDVDIHRYLQDATLSGNRPHGWNFMSPYEEPELRSGKLVFGAKVGRTITIHENGHLSLKIDIDGLKHGRKERDIYPFALVEYPVALFRLASCLYRSKSGTVLADAALIGIQEWTLRPYSPRSIHFQYPLHPAQSWTESRDMVWEQPLVFQKREIFEEPDWCGFRLIRPIYEAFGYSEDKIPMEFDHTNRRLIISDN